MQTWAKQGAAGFRDALPDDVFSQNQHAVSNLKREFSSPCFSSFRSEKLLVVAGHVSFLAS